MYPKKNPVKYIKTGLMAIIVIAILPVHAFSQDSTKKLLNLNQNKLVKKVNSILDSAQKKVKGDILNKANEVKQKANSELNSTVSKFTPVEEERPLPYERLLKTKYTLGRRAYQNTVSQFNYLFNAEEELKNIIQKARNQFQDDYSTLINFYDYDLATTSKSSIDSIIYRCNANIVLHDLRSNWVDDAYLLLAKSYLFHRNFDTSASILQFINYSFDEKDNGMDLPIGSNLRKTNGQFSIATKENNRAWENVNVRNESMIWQARNYFETNAINEGISLLQLLKADALFPKRLHPFLNEQLAYGYYLMESYENAAKNLETALPNAEDDLAKSRWYYLIAQLWQKVDNTNNAYKWYKKANEFSPNPIIGVYAKINMIRIESKNANNSWESLASELERMTRKEKYKPYIDIIYFEMAKLAIQNKSIHKANEWLVTAIKNNKSNLVQKQKAFELLGNINYEYSNYNISKIAYDSLNGVLKTNPQFEQIILRKKWINTINEQTINYQKEDSLMYFYHLAQAQQATSANAWANRLQIERLYLMNLFADKPVKYSINNSTEISSNFNLNNFNGSSSTSSFYFDNVTTISQGKQSFIQKWGERPNVDQWRRKTSNNIANANAKNINTNLVTLSIDSSLIGKKNNTKKDSITYKLITNSTELQDAQKKWNTAALTTAQTFLLKLNDFEKAKPIYQKIIEKNIDSVITERALLDMASQYLHDGETEKSNQIIDVVNSRFPNGIFASKKSEDEKKKNKDKEIVNEYKEAYFLSQIGNWDKLNQLANIINSDIRKTKWNIPFQFLKVKMYAQQKQDSLALLLLDSIMTMNKNDIIKEKAKNIIAEIKNRKGTEDYLADLQFTKEQITPSENLAQKTPEINNSIIVENSSNKDAAKIDTYATNTKKNNTILNVTPTKAIPIIKPRIEFILDSLEPQYLAFVTKGVKPMFVKEMQNAFSNVNNDEFSNLKLSSTFIQFENDIYIVWVGPFENLQKSAQYLNRIKPRLQNELISFVSNKQYDVYIISKSNILLIKSQEDLLLYKDFMLNKIYKP